ncbi:MAG: class I SAM-dependent methyltransferase [Gemmatimonadota bacterium]
MLQRIRASIPAPVKRGVRHALLDPIGQRVRDWQLRAMIRQLRAGASLTRSKAMRLREVWGNKGFSADCSFLLEVARSVACSSGPVLECGTGLTTVVAALAAEQKGTSVWCLEQDPEWAAAVRRRLRMHGIANVEVRVAPLREYEGFAWYNLADVELPQHFALVVCDGPAIFEPTPFAAAWRYGVIPILAERRVHVSELLLDDADDPRASRLLSHWATEFGVNYRVVDTGDGKWARVIPEPPQRDDP